jgi:hypothetical protein
MAHPLQCRFKESIFGPVMQEKVVSELEHVSAAWGLAKLARYIQLSPEEWFRGIHPHIIRTQPALN